MRVAEDVTRQDLDGDLASQVRSRADRLADPARAQTRGDLITPIRVPCDRRNGILQNPRWPESTVAGVPTKSAPSCLKPA